MRRAVIDIGTNSVLMLIAETGRTKNLHVIRDCAEISRLGEGISKTSEISATALDRTLSVLDEFVTICRNDKIESIDIIGTAVFRRATNAGLVIEAIREHTGHKLTVLTGEEEAEYSFISALPLPVNDGRNYIVIDVGGGSTEIIKRSAGASLEAASLPFGAVSLKERFFTEDPPLPETLVSLRAVIRTELGAVLTPDRSVSLIGTGGTVTTLAAMHLQLLSFNGDRIDGTVLSRNDVEKLYSRLSRITAGERFEIPGMEKGREDIITPGTAIVFESMLLLEVQSIQVSSKGVRYGRFLSEMRKSL